MIWSHRPSDTEHWLTVLLSPMISLIQCSHALHPHHHLWISDQRYLQHWVRCGVVLPAPSTRSFFASKYWLSTRRLPRTSLGALYSHQRRLTSFISHAFQEHLTENYTIQVNKPKYILYGSSIRIKYDMTENNVNKYILNFIIALQTCFKYHFN